MDSQDDPKIEASVATFEDGRIAELVFRPNHNPSCAFAVWSPKKEKSLLAEDLKLDNGQLAQPPQDKLIGRVVMVPTGTKEYGSDTQLSEEIRDFIHRYVDVGVSYEQVAACYVLLTWVFDRFNCLPYLRVLGDYGRGKTRFLEVVGNIVYRGIFLAGVTSRAALYRLINRYQGTLLIDEGDFARSALSADLVKILNLGVSPTFEVILCNNALGLESFRVYSPKIIATRQTFKDRALESRCLTQEMVTSPREGIPKVLPPKFKQEAEDLRNKLLLWRFRNYSKTELDSSTEIEGIEPRLNQVIMPLLSIIKDHEARRQIREFVEEYQSVVFARRRLEKPAQVLKAIIVAKEKGKDLTMQTIAQEYNIKAKDDEQITARKCGYLARRILKLDAEFRGKNYQVIWDERKISKLKSWYGLR